MLALEDGYFRRRMITSVENGAENIWYCKDRL